MKYRLRTALTITIVLVLRSSLVAQTEQDFSFFTGSCAYVGHQDGDTSLYTYHGETNIFYSMSQKKADFMLWLGDNWYLDEPEWESVEGLKKKAHYARTVKTLQPLIKMHLPEYAIWDDHDYGPDQSNKNYPLKRESREIFMDTWPDNPSYGEDGEGIYTSFIKADVQFILLDDRWFRDRDSKWDYGLFKPNPNKRMFGEKQMQWLKRKLLEDSNVHFRIIVNGSQMINPLAKGDCFAHFPVEYNDLLNFISENGVKGVMFLSGDRHYSEIIRLDRKGTYPLYDVTVSPLTSTPDPVKGREKHSRYRVNGSYFPQHNFSIFSFTGDAENRKLSVHFFDVDGRELFHWTIAARDLQ